jgi:transcription elongation factor Elf1
MICRKCNSDKVVKCGKQIRHGGKVQGYACGACGYRFVEKKENVKSDEGESMGGLVIPKDRKPVMCPICKQLGMPIKSGSQRQMLICKNCNHAFANKGERVV